MTNLLKFPFPLSFLYLKVLVVASPTGWYAAAKVFVVVNLSPWQIL